MVWSGKVKGKYTLILLEFGFFTKNYVLITNRKIMRKISYLMLYGRLLFEN